MQYTLKRSIFLLLTSPICLFSLGGNPELVKGAADYQVSGPSEVITVSDKTILEYQRFNIDQQESTKYVQPSSKSTLLCRIKGRDPSTIKGRLEANGKLLFINPNGIIFSETAHVNVGTLIASTLDIRNDDFLNDRYKFTLSPKSTEAGIVNNGRIDADNNVVFMASHIINHGTIAVKAGTIALIGGEVTTLDFDGDQMIQFAVEAPLKKGHIEQGGVLAASQVFMKLPMAQKAIRSVLNDSGVIEAHHIEIKDGVIRLQAGSKTYAKELHVDSDSVQIEGDLNVSGLCDIRGRQEVLWCKENTVGHLNIETDFFHVKGAVIADKWTSHVTGQYVLENSITINNNALIFDAPVYLNAANVSLSTGKLGELGGPMEFNELLKSTKTNEKLTLSTGSGDIDFKKPVSLNRLEIRSAHNVNTDAMQVGEWSQQGVKGITTIGGDIQAKNAVALQGYALNIAHDITVENGPLSMDIAGHLKSSETITLSAASMTQTGSGDVFLGGKWVAGSGGISIEGNVHLLGNVVIQAPKGDVLFKRDIGGLGGLRAQAGSFSVKGNIGRIADLSVDATEFIKLSNVGRGNEGIEGMLRLHAKGPIYFEGTEYIAAGHDYKSDSSYEFIPGQTTTFFARSMAPIAFQASVINLGESAALEIRSNQGPVELPSVQGQAGSRLNVHVPKSELKIGRVQDVDRLDLNAYNMNLQSTIDAGSIRLAAHESIHISHSLTAHQGDFIVDAPLLFDAPEITLQALHGKLMRFEKSLSGDTKLTLHAPEGEIVMRGSLRGAKKFQQVNLFAKKITQYEAVVSTGPVHYTADHIFLGHDIITDNAITLDGPVTLFNTDAIHLIANKYNKGPILLTSTLDADQPTRTLMIQNAKSLTQIKGAIGLQGPLRELVITSGKVIFHDNIGGSAPGIVNRLAIKSVGVECRGSMYYAGEQMWNTIGIHLTHEGAVELKTAGLPLRFGLDARIELDKTTAFSIATQGGLLDLAPVISDRSQPITIQTGHGEAHLKEIGKNIAKLHIEGREVLFSGHLEADQIFIQADNHIEYDLTRGKEIISTALKSKGNITLNSKQDTVGSPERPLNIEAAGNLHVGAKTVAYLEGRCADQYPYVYPGNPPPRIFFNGYEYLYFFYDDLADDNALLKTLTPALSQSVPTAFMDGSALKPRKAPIYYDTSSTASK